MVDFRLDLLLPECHRCDYLAIQDTVIDTSRFSEIIDLPEAGNQELALFTQIVDKQTVDPGPQYFMTATRKG
jgi:hypothetical protein